MSVSDRVQIDAEMQSKVIEAASLFGQHVTELAERIDKIYQLSKQYNQNGKMIQQLDMHMFDSLSVLMTVCEQFASSLVGITATITPLLYLSTRFRNGIVTEITYKRMSDGLQAGYHYSLLLDDDTTVYFWQSEIGLDEAAEYCERIKKEMMTMIQLRREEERKEVT